MLFELVKARHQIQKLGKQKSCLSWFVLHWQLCAWDAHQRVCDWQVFLQQESEKAKMKMQLACFCCWLWVQLPGAQIPCLLRNWNFKSFIFGGIQSGHVSLAQFFLGEFSVTLNWTGSRHNLLGFAWFHDFVQRSCLETWLSINELDCCSWDFVSATIKMAGPLTWSMNSDDVIENQTDKQSFLIGLSEESSVILASVWHRRKAVDDELITGKKVAPTNLSHGLIVISDLNAPSNLWLNL